MWDLLRVPVLSHGAVRSVQHCGSTRVGPPPDLLLKQLSLSHIFFLVYKKDFITIM